MTPCSFIKLAAWFGRLAAELAFVPSWLSAAAVGVSVLLLPEPARSLARRMVAGIARVVRVVARALTHA